MYLNQCSFAAAVYHLVHACLILPAEGRIVTAASLLCWCCHVRWLTSSLRKNSAAERRRYPAFFLLKFSLNLFFRHVPSANQNTYTRRKVQRKFQHPKLTTPTVLRIYQSSRHPVVASSGQKNSSRKKTGDGQTC
jgi:hypothetical protein